MTPEVRAARRRKVRLYVLAGLGGAVMAALVGLGATLYADDRVPLWGLVVALGLIGLVAASLVVLGLREFVAVVQGEVQAMYDVEPSSRAAPPAVAMLLVFGLLLVVLLTDVITGLLRWIVAGVLGVLVVALYLVAWRAGVESRRRVKEARRQRGYLPGEQPWSWWAHAGYGIFFGAMVPLQLWNAVRSAGGSWSWYFWAGCALFIAMLTSIAWSATQKWRRERRGVTRAGEAA